MGRLEALSQIIVPLIFLAIWAITSLLNRDAQPLPQRPARPGGRPGPNALGPAARRSEPSSLPGSTRRPGGEGPPRNGSDRRPGEENPQASPRPARRPTPSGTNDADVYLIDDQVLFVDPVGRAPSSTPLPERTYTPPEARTSAARKSSKSRREDANRGRSSKDGVSTQRALSEQVGNSLSQNRGKPLALSPLTSNLTSLGSSSLRVASAAAAVTPNEERPALEAADVRRMLADRPKLREVAILTELLQPPVSLRGHRRPR